MCSLTAGIECQKPGLLERGWSFALPPGAERAPFSQTPSDTVALSSRSGPVTGGTDMKASFQVLFV